MSEFVSHSLTNAGIALLAKSVAGETITFTKIMLGSGELQSSQDIAGLTHLVSPKATLDITKCEAVSPTSAIVGGIFTNAGIRNGFTFREIGLFADDPDLGEILYAYANAGNTGEWIPGEGSSTIIEKMIDVTTVISGQTRVSAYINAAAYATIEQYEEYKILAEQAYLFAHESSELAQRAYGIAVTSRDQLNAHLREANAAISKVNTIWTSLFTQINTNLFNITFQTLDGLTIDSGVWNHRQSRLEV